MEWQVSKGFQTNSHCWENLLPIEADGNGRRSPEPDPQSQFVNGESELSIAELLFPQEAAWPFLFESTAILPESPLLYA